ncbi:MAG: hypothetical protein COZ08_08570, partial [Bacteroidetes bacterium CG_4_10_14_3_um_filter_42_6]
GALREVGDRLAGGRGGRCGILEVDQADVTSPACRNRCAGLGLSWQAGAQNRECVARENHQKKTPSHHDHHQVVKTSIK